MNCLKCGAPNRDDAKFCRSCKNMFSASPTEAVPMQDRSPPPDPFIPTPKLVVKTGPNWTIIAVAVIIVAIVILFFFIIFFVSPLFSQESDYNSGGASCLHLEYSHVRECDCLGLEYVPLSFEDRRTAYCFGLVSNCKCYDNGCPSSPDSRVEMSCGMVEWGDIDKELFIIQCENDCSYYSDGMGLVTCADLVDECK